MLQTILLSLFISFSFNVSLEICLYFWNFSIEKSCPLSVSGPCLIAQIVTSMRPSSTKWLFIVRHYKVYKPVTVWRADPPIKFGYSWATSTAAGFWLGGYAGDSSCDWWRTPRPPWTLAYELRGSACPLKVLELGWVIGFLDLCPWKEA